MNEGGHVSGKPGLKGPGSSPESWMRALLDGAPADTEPRPHGAAHADFGAFEQLPAGAAERRLVNRAERLWREAHAPDGALPSLDRLGALFAEPFRAQSVLLIFGDRARPLATATQVGEALLPLGVEPSSAVVPDDAGGPEVGRLAALAWRAVHMGAPSRMQPQGEQATILMRATALPVAAPRPSGAALVILSWRQLLPEGEADVLRRELARALCAD